MTRAFSRAEDARETPAHSTAELRRLLREREADLRAAMGEAQAGRAQVRRLNTQLQAVNAQKEELRVAKVTLEEKLAAPVLSESAQRYRFLLLFCRCALPVHLLAHDSLCWLSH